MKLKIESVSQLKIQINKLVDTRRVTQWGSEKWTVINNQVYSLLAKIGSYKQDTLPEHIKKFWK